MRSCFSLPLHKTKLSWQPPDHGPRDHPAADHRHHPGQSARQAIKAQQRRMLVAAVQLGVGDRADELKVIIYNKHDFIFAEEQAEKVNPKAILFLQPEWSKKEEMTPLIVDYVMSHPKWRVSLQTHKYLNIP